MLKSSSDLILLVPSITPWYYACAQSPNCVCLCIKVQNTHHTSGFAGEPREQTQDSDRKTTFQWKQKWRWRWWVWIGEKTIGRLADWCNCADKNRAFGRSQAEWLKVQIKRRLLLNNRRTGRDWRLQWSWYTVWWHQEQVSLIAEAEQVWVLVEGRAGRPTQRHSTQTETVTQDRMVTS